MDTWTDRDLARLGESLQHFADPRGAVESTPSKMTESIPWLWRGRPFNQADVSAGKWFGFVYIITDLSLPEPKRYVGCKQFYFRKNGRRVVSDWQSYWSSSVVLKERVRVYGCEHFCREIVSLHRTIGAMRYSEQELQFRVRAVESDDWYNASINGKYQRINRSASVFA